MGNDLSERVKILEDDMEVMKLIIKQKYPTKRELLLEYLYKNNDDDGEKNYATPKQKKFLNRLAERNRKRL